MNVIEERYPGKVVGIYDQASTAKRAAKRLISQGGVSIDELEIVSPKDERLGEKIEPDDKGIGSTLLASHLILGIVGIFIGLLVASGLILYGIPLANSSPIILLVALAMLGGFMGLMVAGAISVRPDHDAVINEARDASEHNRWTVVVQTKDHEQIKSAKKLLSTDAIKISETF